MKSSRAAITLTTYVISVLAFSIPNAATAGKPSSTSQGQGQGQSQSPNGGQGSAQQQQGQSNQPPTASVESTILTINSVKASSADIVGDVLDILPQTAPADGGAAPMLVVIQESDASTLFTANEALQALSAFNKGAQTWIATLRADELEYLGAIGPAHGLAAGSSLTDASSLLSAFAASVPTITITNTPNIADSNTLVVQLAGTLRRRATGRYTVYTPGLFPFASFADAANDTSPVVTAKANADQYTALLAKEISNLQAAQKTPGKVPWSPKYDSDIAQAQQWNAGYKALITTLNTADANGNTPMSQGITAGNSAALLAQADYVLIVRLLIATGADFSDHGLIDYHRGWLFPLPHDDYYYGGVAVAEYELLDRTGAILTGGVTTRGTSRLSKTDFLKRFDQYGHQPGDTRDPNSPTRAANPVIDENFFKP